jgi:hypothetical protein
LYLVDSLIKVFPGEELLTQKADSLVQIGERIYLDFSKGEEQITSDINASDARHMPVIPKEIVVNYTITVLPYIN